MKKFYLKRRRTLSATERSGTSKEAVQKYHAAVEEMNFLTWINPHIPLRSTYTNLITTLQKKVVSRSLAMITK